MTYKVSRKRSLIKTITWRAIASLDTFLIVWLVTKKLSWAGTIASLATLFLWYLVVPSDWFIRIILLFHCS